MKFLLALLLSSSLLALTACGGQATEQGTRNAPDDSLSLRVAILPTQGCLPLIYAVESGIADSLGLPLRYKLYRAQWDADTALLGKTVDAAYLDAARWAYYQNQGKLKGTTALLPISEQHSLLVGGHLRVRKVEKIKLRTLAAPRYTQQERYLHHLRDSMGWKQDDIFQPQINSYEIATRMLVNEQLDGVVLPEPWATQAAQQGQRVLARAQEFKEAAIYVRPFKTTQTRKQKQSSLLKQVYNAAVEQLNAQRTPLVDSLLTQHYRITPEAARAVQLPRYTLLK